MPAHLTMPDPILAANSAFSKEVFLWLGVIVVLGFLLGIVALVLRRKLMADDAPPPIGFTLADLRAMHAAGQLSDEELAAAEAKTLAKTRAAYLGEETASEESESGSPHDGAAQAEPKRNPDAGAENVQDDPDKNAGDTPGA